MGKDLRCNMCGKEFDIWDTQEDFSLYRLCGYGTKFDGSWVQLKLCCDCLERVVDACTISPIVPSDHEETPWQSTIRVIVAGGRDFSDYPLLVSTLDGILKTYPNIEIISGHARGADMLGEKYAAERGFPCTVFPADWKRNWRRAGFLRNTQMLEYALQSSPLIVAFWDGRSHGTEDMINKARAAGVECVVVSYPKEVSK